MTGNKEMSIKVAAIQMISQDCRTEDNLKRAEDFVKQAAKEGAKLIVFPEFMSQGYRLTPELWKTAEEMDGMTSEWMKHLSSQYGVYIGTSFLERDGRNFYNTFLMTSPQGEIAGTVRKRNPSIWEAYFFKGYRGNQYIDTDLGRIGIGICFDNHTYEVARAISESEVDLMLMPHSYCVPVKPNKLVTESDIIRLKNLPTKVAKLYNELFQIPVVLVNKSGPWDSPLPSNILPKMEEYRFSGRSCIIDYDGKLLEKMDEAEGMIIAEISMKPSVKKRGTVPKYSRYIYPGPAGREITRLMELMGKVSYTRKRKKYLKN